MQHFSVSFIKKPGLRLLAPNIEAAIARGACGRLITSTYQNFTDVDSLQFFYDLGVLDELVDYIIGDDGLFGELVWNLVFHCSQGLTR